MRSLTLLALLGLGFTAGFPAANAQPGNPVQNPTLYSAGTLDVNGGVLPPDPSGSEIDYSIAYAIPELSVGPLVSITVLEPWVNLQNPVDVLGGTVSMGHGNVFSGSGSPVVPDFGGVIITNPGSFTGGTLTSVGGGITLNGGTINYGGGTLILNNPTGGTLYLGSGSNSITNLAGIQLRQTGVAPDLQVPLGIFSSNPSPIDVSVSGNTIVTTTPEVLGGSLLWRNDITPESPTVVGAVVKTGQGTLTLNGSNAPTTPNAVSESSVLIQVGGATTTPPTEGNPSLNGQVNVIFPPNEPQPPLVNLTLVDLGTRVELAPISEFEGQYNVVFESEELAAFAIVKILSDGTVRLSGRAPNGKPWSCSSTMEVPGSVNFDASVGPATLLGTLSIPVNESQLITGTLKWELKDGETSTLTAFGITPSEQPSVQVPRNVDFTITFPGRDKVAHVPITIDADNRVLRAATASASVKMAIKPNGQFQGTFITSGRNFIRFSGLLEADGIHGGGVLTYGAKGKVSITPR